MRILMISTDRGLFEEGSDVRGRHIDYGELVSELHIIVFAKKELNLEKESIAKNVTLYPTNSSSIWRYIPDAVRIGKKLESMDLVTTQDPAESGLAGLKLARYFKVPLQIQIHADMFDPYFLKHSVLNLLRTIIAKYTLARADCIRVVSKRLYDSVVALRIKDIEAKTVILPIFVDVQRFMSATPKFDLRKKYPKFKKIILVLGRLEPEKNVDLAIESMREIVKNIPNAGLIIVGDGSKHLALERKSADMEGIVVFEGWQEDRISYYKGADLLLVTSHYEGYGMVIVEALASGLPVLSLDVGVAREAGAVVVDEEHLVDRAVKLLSHASRKPELKNQPYRNYMDYEEKLVKAWGRCK
jgi:glycosyltransferase involved in cell wall biosynthesis